MHTLVPLLSLPIHCTRLSSLNIGCTLARERGTCYSAVIMTTRQHHSHSDPTCTGRSCIKQGLLSKGRHHEAEVHNSNYTPALLKGSNSKRCLRSLATICKIPAPPLMRQYVPTRLTQFGVNLTRYVPAHHDCAQPLLAVTPDATAVCRLAAIRRKRSPLHLAILPHLAELAFAVQAIAQSCSKASL